MVEDEVKTYEDIFDMDGKNLLRLMSLVSTKIQPVRDGLKFSKLFGQRVMNVIYQIMRKMLSVKEI